MPDTDTTVFWASQLIILKDKRFCVSGDFVNLNTHKHQLFFAIINKEVTNIDVLKIIETPNSVQNNSLVENENGDLIFYVIDNATKFKKIY